jgi:hypothetical protein
MRLLTRFNPETKLETSKQHRLRIENQPCPKCFNRNLNVLLLEEGTKGWEARVECDRCGSKMVINESGFHMDFTSGIGDKKQ